MQKKPKLRVLQFGRAHRQEIKEMLATAADLVRLSHEFSGGMVILSRPDGTSVQLAAGDLKSNRHAVYHTGRISLDRLFKTG